MLSEVARFDYDAQIGIKTTHHIIDYIHSIELNIADQVREQIRNMDDEIQVDSIEYSNALEKEILFLGETVTRLSNKLSNLQSHSIPVVELV